MKLLRQVLAKLFVQLPVPALVAEPALLPYATQGLLHPDDTVRQLCLSLLSRCLVTGPVDAPSAKAGVYPPALEAMVASPGLLSALVGRVSDPRIAVAQVLCFPFLCPIRVKLVCDGCRPPPSPLPLHECVQKAADVCVLIVAHRGDAPEAGPVADTIVTALAALAGACAFPVSFSVHPRPSALAAQRVNLLPSPSPSLQLHWTRVRCPSCVIPQKTPCPSSPRACLSSSAGCPARRTPAAAPSIAQVCGDCALVVVCMKGRLLVGEGSRAL